MGVRLARYFDSLVHLYLNMLWVSTVDTNSSHLGRLRHTANYF